MFQTMILVALPALVTLTAAFFILRNIYTEEESQRASAAPWRHSSGHNSSAPHVRQRKNRPDQAAGECVICFEDVALVELYPCGHRELCEDCVHRIVTTSKRSCPLCRQRISGYQ